MSSSTNRPLASTSTSAAPERSYFESQRAALLSEIAVSFEHVLANINKLNRSLEGVIAVGNEFSSVEALWSQFENVMAKDPDAEGEGLRTSTVKVTKQEKVEIRVMKRFRGVDKAPLLVDI